MNELSSRDYKSLSCGVDLGGTKVVVALVTPVGEIVNRETIRDHRDATEDQIVMMIASAIRRMIPASVQIGQLAGIGVGTAGHVDYARGVLISNSNLPGFTNYPLASRMSEELGAAVSVDNDANAQAFAEYRYGAGHGCDNVAFVTVSTGLGAGFVIGGRVYRGVTGIAGEIGHTIVNPDGQIRCGCGNYGCLMAHASGLTLPEVIQGKLRAPGVETKINFESLAREDINGELVKSGLDDGDPLCAEVVAEYARYLGIGLHNLVQTMNPGVIVVGGGLTAWGPTYLDQVREKFQSLAARTINEPPQIKLSELGADAAVIGAAALGKVHQVDKA